MKKYLTFVCLMMCLTLFAEVSFEAEAAIMTPQKVTNIGMAPYVYDGNINTASFDSTSDRSQWYYQIKTGTTGALVSVDASVISSVDAQRAEVWLELGKRPVPGTDYTSLYRVKKSGASIGPSRFFHISASEAAYISLKPEKGKGEVRFTVTVYPDEPDSFEEQVDVIPLKTPVNADCPTSDTDCYRFRTGSGKLYRLGINGEMLNDNKEWVLRVSVLKDGKKVFYELIKAATVNVPGKGRDICLQLEPNTDYQLEVGGTSCKYTFTVGDLFLNDLPLNNPSVVQTDDILLQNSLVDPVTGADRAVCEYTGNEIRPTVKLSIVNQMLSMFASGDRFIALTEGIDYDVIYKDNVNPGTATATVVGKGGVTGSFDLYYTITAPPLPAKGTSLSKGSATYKVTGNTVGNVTVAYAGTGSKGTSVSIPSTVTIGDTVYKVTSIASNAFKNNRKITKVTIGSNVTVIGSGAFSGCTKLKTVKGASKVATVGKNAFSGCTKLVQVGNVSKTVTLTSVKIIGANAFKGCKAIAKVNISSTALTKIDASSFQGCTSLKSFTAKSKKLSVIGSKAFYGDKKLSSITLKTAALKKSSVGSNAFKGIKSSCKIKVPSSKVKSYKKIFKTKGAGSKVSVTK